MIGDGARADEPAPRPLVKDFYFLTFWAGQTVSQFGAKLGSLALSVLAVSLLRATEAEVGILNAAAVAAFLLVGLPAGAWVDRWLKRRVMIFADLVRMAAMLVVPVLWTIGLLQIWHLFIVAAIIGFATVFFDVAYQSYVPFLVPRKQVADANAKLETSAQVAQIGGPAIGGGLLSIISAPLLFLAEAIGYATSAVFLTFTRDDEVPQPREQRRPLVSEIREGMGFVMRHPLLRRIVACTGGVNLFTSVAFTLFPILVLRDLDLGPAGLGLVFSVGSVGGLLGAMLTPRLARRLGEGTLIPVSTIVGSLFLFLIPLTVLVSEKWMALAMLIVSEGGFAFSVLAYNIMQVSMRQRICPPRLLGRMNASIRFIVYGVMPISALAAGGLGAWLGVVPATWISVIGSLLSAAPVLFSSLLRMKTLPDTPDGGTEDVNVDAELLKQDPSRPHGD